MFSFFIFITCIITNIFGIISGLFSSEALAPELLIFVKGMPPDQIFKSG